MTIKTILFDLDGTLIDTNELIIGSFQYTFDHYGVKFTREEIMQFNGPPLKETFRIHGGDRAEEMTNTYRTHNISNHDLYVKAFPHVVEVVEKLHTLGYKLGIVTTKMQPTVDMGLKLTGIDRFFDTVVTYNDVTHPKPHPEPVIKAMDALGGKADSTIMIGDNYHDILSGKNAGVQTAGVAWAHKGRETLEAHNPTYMLEDMRDLYKVLGI